MRMLYQSSTSSLEPRHNTATITICTAHVSTPSACWPFTSVLFAQPTTLGTNQLKGSASSRRVIPEPRRGGRQQLLNTTGCCGKAYAVPVQLHAGVPIPRTSDAIGHKLDDVRNRCSRVHFLLAMILKHRIHAVLLESRSQPAASGRRYFYTPPPGQKRQQDAGGTTYVDLRCELYFIGGVGA